jgi:hypothetical protein
MPIPKYLQIFPDLNLINQNLILYKLNHIILFHIIRNF